jgi:hypothetical protein
MVRVFSGGVKPSVEFGVKYCKVKGMVAGISAEPSSSGLNAKVLDEAHPSVVKLCEYFCEVVWVGFMGLVIRISPS